VRTVLDLSQASCVGTDPEAFFKEGGPPTTEHRLAKRVCMGCPEREPCLEWALRHELYGIWGGTSAPERKAMRVELGIPYSAPEIGWVSSRRRSSEEDG
jgi:hypothetical protein